MDMGIIFTRRSPEYLEQAETWKRSLDAYAGGRGYIRLALVKHLAELSVEFSERQARAYYVNLPKRIARTITNYALSTEPARENADPEMVEDFSRSGSRVNEVMRQASTMLNVTGRAWLLVDMPAFAGSIDMERKQRERLRPFCSVLSPLAVTDWAYGADGRLAWAIVQEKHVYKEDPFRPPAEVLRARLWRRDSWELFENRSAGPQSVARGDNPAGQVPLVEIVEPDGYGMDARHWFEDVVTISDAILNNESEAQMNVVKQMFGMLVVSESFARSASRVERDKDPEGGKSDKLACVIARSAAIFETAEEKNIARYISPSGAETQTIRSEIDALKRELYDTVGLALSNASRAAQTAESKTWDFQNTSQYLGTRADLLEQAELRVWELMHAWDGSIGIPKVTYNRIFDVVDLEKAISALVQASGLPSIGIEFTKQLQRSALEVLEQIAPVPDEAKKAIQGEIATLRPAPGVDPDFGFGGGGDEEDVDI